MTSRSRGLSRSQLARSDVAASSASRTCRSRCRAAATASSMSWSRNGLARKSTAPAFMARTDIGMSPWPVMKMMGMWMFACWSWAWKSRPLTPGRRMWSTRQLAPSGRLCCRNSAVEPNSSTCRSTERNRRLKATRAEGSTSTTNTTGRAWAARCGCGPRLTSRPSRRTACPAGQGELESRPGAVVAGSPYASSIRFDDRPADRQAHAHAVRPGREESVEQAAHVFGIDADARIAHRNKHLFGLHEGVDHEAPWPVGYGFHRLHAVHHQVDDDLLQLDAAGEHRRQIAGEVELQSDAMVLNLALDQGDALGDDLVQVEKRRLLRRLPGERAQPLDDLAGTLAVTDYAFHRAADLAELRLLAVEPAQAGLAIGDDAGERLVHLVGDRGTHLPERGHTRGMGQRRLRRMQRLLRFTGFRDVDQRANDLVFAGFEPHAVGADVKVLRRAVRHQPTELVVAVLFALSHAVDLMLHDPLVILMNPLQKQVDRGLHRLIKSQHSIAFF